MKNITFLLLSLAVLLFASCSKTTNYTDAVAGTYRSSDNFSAVITAVSDKSISLEFDGYRGIAAQMTSATDFSFDMSAPQNVGTIHYIGGGTVKNNILTVAASVTITYNGTSTQYIPGFTGVRVP